MELTFAQQSQAFLYSILMGIALGVMYDLFKIIRLAFCNSRRSVFALDFVYMLIFSLAIYYFSLAYLNGCIRIYVYLGSTFGVLLYTMTVGRVLCKFYRPIISFFKKILNKTLSNLKKIGKKLLKITRNILYNVFIAKLKKNNDSQHKKVTGNNEKEKRKRKRTKHKSS